MSTRREQLRAKLLARRDDLSFEEQEWMLDLAERIAEELDRHGNEGSFEFTVQVER